MSLFLSVCEFCHNHGAKGVCCWGLSLKRVLERRVWCVYHITMWCHRTPLSKIHMGLVRWNIKSPKLSLGWSLCHQFYPSIHLVIKCHSSWINFTLDCHVKMKYSYKQNINKILGRDYLFSSINKAELIVYMSEEQQKQSIVLQSKQQKNKEYSQHLCDYFVHLWSKGKSFWKVVSSCLSTQHCDNSTEFGDMWQDCMANCHIS